jgi:nicotinamide-nucleotide amidase
VCFSVSAREGASEGGGRITRSARLPGNRADVRDRATTVALHLLRRLLLGEVDAVPLPGEVARSGMRSERS